MHIRKQVLVGVMLMASVGGVALKTEGTSQNKDDSRKVDVPVPQHVQTNLARLCGEQAGCNALAGTFLYQQRGGNYADYPSGAAFGNVYLIMDEQQQVREYWLDVYDQDENLVRQGVKPDVGDQFRLLTFATVPDGDSAWTTATVGPPVHVTPGPPAAFLALIVTALQRQATQVALPVVRVGWQTRFVHLFNTVAGHQRSSLSRFSR